MKLIGIMLFAFALISCTEMKSSMKSKEVPSVNPVNEIKIATSAQAGEKVSISSLKAGTITEYYWTVRNDLGVDITWRCSPTRTAAIIECNFQEVGNSSIYLTAKMKDGSVHNYDNKIQITPAPAGADQPPTIDLTMTQGSKVIRVTNLNNAAEQIPSFFRNQVIAFDLQASTDDLSPGNLSYSVSFAGLSPASYSTPVFNHAMSLVGTYSVTVEVTDAAGNVAKKVFDLLITCDSSATPPTIDNITATYQNAGNFWTFNAQMGPGGQGPFTYKWDFNGDGIFDTDWLPTPTVNTNKITTFRGTRAITALVKDSACMFVGDDTIDVNFDSMTKMSGVNTPPPRSQFQTYTKTWSRQFVQVEINPGANNSALAGVTNMPGAGMADFIAIKDSARPDPSLVECDYKPESGTFVLRGINYYDTSSRQGVRHGVALQIKGLPGLPSVGQIIPSSTVSVTQARYYSDMQANISEQIIYKKDGNCSAVLELERLPDSPVSCGAGKPATISRSFRVYGIFSCDKLSSSDAKDLGYNNGAFSCHHTQVGLCTTPL